MKKQDFVTDIFIVYVRIDDIYKDIFTVYVRIDDIYKDTVEDVEIRFYTKIWQTMN